MLKNDAVSLSSSIPMNPKLFCNVFEILSINNFLNVFYILVLYIKRGYLSENSHNG